MARAPRLLGLVLALVAVAAGCVHEPAPRPRSPIPEGKVAVIGEVLRPGLYDHHPGMTLLELVRLAGGLTVTAAPERASVTRFSSGLAASAGLRLDEILTGRAPDPPLEAGDLVQVPP